MVGRDFGQRVGLLFVVPVVIYFLLSSDSGAFTFTLFTSFGAAGLDTLRQRKKCLPFPIYLLLVYALQTSYYLVASHVAHMSPNDPLEAVPPAGQKVEDMTSSANANKFLAANTEEVPAGPIKPATPVQTFSIVMAAHNEHKYMKRTLASIYERTPASALREIIVVDDGSEPPLAGECSDYPDVKIMRNEERKGLIKSKTMGGNAATSDVIMFLDAHVKPEWNWVDPILKHINTNYKRVVVPLIPILDGETWEPNNNAVGTKMMFDWSLMFNWFEDFNDLVPCMSGGLFAISRQWWHESGEYDYQMMMWGAENIEQSIRIWLCGGEIYVARDSRIAHVFRSAFPYKINNTEIYINKVRTVETWFDEYKTYYYEADPVARQFVPKMGDISERRSLQKKLHCRPFKWYVEKFKDTFTERHMLPEEVFLIRDKQSDRCLRSSDDQQHVNEYPCDENDKMQKWTVAYTGEGLRNVGAKRCLDANAGVREKDGTELFMYGCYGKNPQQHWEIANGNLRWAGKTFCVKPSTKDSDYLQQLTLVKCGEFLEQSGPFEKYMAKVAPI